MKILNNIKPGPKLLISFLLVGLVPLTIVGIISSGAAKKALNRAAFEKLETVKQTKKGQIEGYFRQIFDELETLTLNQDAYYLYEKFDSYGNVSATTEKWDAGDITQNIGQVSQLTEEMANSSGQVNLSAKE